MVNCLHGYIVWVQKNFFFFFFFVIATDIGFRFYNLFTNMILSSIININFAYTPITFTVERL